MNKKIQNKSLLVITMMVVLFSGCEKNSEDISSDKNIINYSLSRATDYGNDWIYFSFKEGKEITIREGEHKTNLSWDIAFNKFNFRTNSGLSGVGKGGAIETAETNIAKLSTAPAGGYVTDNEIEITKDLSSFPPPQITTSGNTVLANAIKFSGPPPSYNLSNKVYVVKTADGKYAKLIFTSYHNAKGQSGYVSFSYKYQSDGSTNLN